MLNNNQKRVVNSDLNSHTICQALAGTGKTTVLLARTKHIIQTRLNQGETPKLLLIAFSKDVANTLLARLEPELKDYITIKTTHALAYQEISRSSKSIGLNSNFNITNPNILKYKFSSWLKANKNRLGKLVWEEETMGLVISISTEMGNDPDAYIDPKKLTKIANLKRSMAPFEFSELIDLIMLFKQFRLGSGNLMYSDLLGLASSIQPNKLNMYTDVLVDEAQDLNKSQLSLIFNIAKQAKGTTWVLDQHQSIFGFQGSVPSIISELNKEYHDAKYFVLSDNYRCSGNIISLANKILEHDLSTSLRLTKSKDEGSYVQTYSDPGGLVGWINYMKSCGYDQKDIVVLYRSSAELLSIESLLISGGVEYESTDNSFFEIPMVKAFLTAVEAQLGLITYEDFLDLCSFVKLDASIADDIWVKTGSGKGFSTNIKNSSLLMSLSNSNANKFQKIVNLVAAATNISEVGLLVAEYNNTAATKFLNPTKFADDKYVMNNLIQWLVSSCSETKTILGVIADIKEKIRTKPDGSNGIRLITMHSSKGREWPCVAIWVTPLKYYKTQTAEEELRLLYVASTRAMDEMCIIDPVPNNNSISRHVPDPIGDLVKEMLYG